MTLREEIIRDSGIEESLDLKTIKYNVKQVARDVKATAGSVMQWAKYIGKVIADWFVNNGAAPEERHDVFSTYKAEGDVIMIGFRVDKDKKVYNVMDIDGNSKTVKVFRNQINALSKRLDNAPVAPNYLAKLENQMKDKGYKIIDSNKVL